MREQLYQDLRKACQCARRGRSHAEAERLISDFWKKAKSTHGKNDQALRRAVRREINMYLRQYEEVKQKRKGTISIGCYLQSSIFSSSA